MNITNNHSTDLGLPDGQILPARQTTPVRDWDKIKDNAVVQAWLKAKILMVGDASRSQFVLADKEELIAKLAALGIKADKRSHIEKLQTQLAEAEKKQAAAMDILHGSDKLPSHIEIAEGKTVQLGEVVALAHAASNMTADGWNALPDAERDALIEFQIEGLKAEAATGLYTGRVNVDDAAAVKNVSEDAAPGTGPFSSQA